MIRVPGSLRLSHLSTVFVIHATPEPTRVLPLHPKHRQWGCTLGNAEGLSLSRGEGRVHSLTQQTLARAARHTQSKNVDHPEMNAKTLSLCKCIHVPWNASTANNRNVSLKRPLTQNSSPTHTLELELERRLPWWVFPFCHLRSGRQGCSPVTLSPR